MNTDIPAGAIVVGLDRSRHSHAAAAWAAGKARRQGRPLVALSAFDPASGYEFSDYRLGLEKERREADVAVLREAHPDVTISDDLELGDARIALIDASRHAHEVVVGSRGLGPISSMLLGSVGAALARQSACPLTVVRPHNPGLVHRGVLVGIDSSPESRVVLEHGFREASELDVPLTVRHCVWDTTAPVTTPHLITGNGDDVEPSRLLMAEAVAGFSEKYPDVHVTTELASGFPEHALVPGSELFTLLVIGRHPHSAYDRVLHTSVATGVVERARCPVMVVPV